MSCLMASSKGVEKTIALVENMDYYGEYYTQIDTSFFEWYATNDSFFIHFENDDYYYYYDSDYFY